MVLVYVCLRLRRVCEGLVFGGRMLASDIGPRIAKGLLCSKSPMCTLSQNGYGGVRQRRGKSEK